MNRHHLTRMVATVSTPGPSTTVDDMGDPLPGALVVDVVRCWCEQSSSDELTDGRDVTRQRWRLYTVPGATISARSTVTVDRYPGITFAVDGDPWSAINPRTLEPSYVETLLVNTDGAR